jgi:2'-5' RNA ligase
VAVRAGGFEISFRGHGFFPTAKAPRVFWIGIAASPQLAALAKSVG